MHTFWIYWSTDVEMSKLTAFIGNRRRLHVVKTLVISGTLYLVCHFFVLTTYCDHLRSIME